MQTIYYPGFTIGGLVAEAGSLLLLLVLLLHPFGTLRFWWLAVEFGALLLLHAIYWLVIHPVNSSWLKGTSMPSTSRAFFSVRAGAEMDWARMRDVWEYSHVARAICGLFALLSMTLALLSWPWPAGVPRAA